LFYNLIPVFSLMSWISSQSDFQTAKYRCSVADPCPRSGRKNCSYPDRGYRIKQPDAAKLTFSSARYERMFYIVFGVFPEEYVAYLPYCMFRVHIELDLWLSRLSSTPLQVGNGASIIIYISFHLSLRVANTAQGASTNFLKKQTKLVYFTYLYSYILYVRYSFTSSSWST
jgi:hypothetical protein